LLGTLFTEAVFRTGLLGLAGIFASTSQARIGVAVDAAAALFFAAERLQQSAPGARLGA
jgi:hypothetical protein